ncbi:hypothetical protein FOCC_FOCC000973 [Frankliniella occidentalis]|nr:hypothetical protein FOCC_FOCC000973 [Frankliniella occidentalis]
MGSRTVIAILVATFLVSTCSASPSKSVSLVGAGELCDLYYAISLTDGRCNGNEKIPVPCDGWCAAYIQCKDGVPETKGTDCTWLNNYFDPNKKKCTFNMWRNCDWYKSLTMPPTTHNGSGNYCQHRRTNDSNYGSADHNYDRGAYHRNH